MPRITAVKTVLLTGPCTNDPYLLDARKLRSAAFIEVHTDSGLTGLGETYAGYSFPEVIPEIVSFFEPILVDQMVEENIEAAAWVREMWSRMYMCGNFWCRVGLGAAALTGVEAALWDLQGKLRGKPVCELLGGARHAKLPCYATGGHSNYPKDRLSKKADFYLGLGFKGLKVGVGKFEEGEFVIPGNDPESHAAFEADKIAFLRKHCGDGVNLMVDGHMGNCPEGTWTVEIAKAVANAFEPFNLFFFEEPLPYSDAAGYAELAESTRVPIAGGECLSALPEWLEYLRRDSFDIGQPDAAWVGGIGEFLRIAHEFEKRGRKVATHAWGAGGALMQNLHAGFAAPNTCMLEIAPAFGPLHSEVVGDSYRFQDGFILPPQTAGLGIVLTDRIKQKFPFIPGTGEFNSVPGKVLTT